MKMIELMRGFSPMEFGKTREGSPLLRWLMVDGAGNPRMDVAEWVWDELRKREVVRFDNKTGLWSVNPGEEPPAWDADNPERIDAAFVGAALGRLGGRSDFPHLRDQLAVDLGHPVRHWSFIRSIKRAEEKGWVERLPGRGQGYVLTADGQERFHSEMLEGEREAQEERLREEARQIVLTPAEQAALVDRLPVRLTVIGDWFTACAGALPLGRLLAPFQLNLIAEAHPERVEKKHQNSGGFLFRNRQSAAVAEPVDLD